ncbi:MAG: PepSY-associated TM helix domain-containing protein [Pseudomonadota bacterium]
MGLPAQTVKQALAGHSWLGVAFGALIYIVCLSGTLLVLHAELEHWEQADAPVLTQFDLAAAESTFNEFLARGDGVTPHMYLVLPTDETPYARLATENASWFFEADGTLGIAEHNHFSETLLDLHLYLHLPKAWGMLLVSALGAVLVGFIISGFLAHPGILRDAFRLRQRGSEQLAQTDLHNRLSVWAAPFHLTIAITGAYFGLALPVLAVVAEAEFDGDRMGVVSEVFGAEPELAPRSGPVAIGAALARIGELAPDATPFSVIVHDADSPTPLLEIFARHPGRLTWGEAYRFEIDGTYIGPVGWAGGETGQQILYSIYRLHFGTFDGALSKLVYLLLGFALTVVAASGGEIWLAKRRRQDGLDDLWTGIVWGTPIAIVVSAGIGLVGANGVLGGFWLSLASACALALALRDTARARALLQRTLALFLFALVAAHVAVYGADAARGHPLLVNALACLAAATLGALALRSGHRPAAVQVGQSAG